MGYQLGPSNCVPLTGFIFFLCLLTFVNVPETTLSQDTSRLLGYPTWHPPIKGNDYNKSDSALLFSSLLMAITCYLAARWTAYLPSTRKLQTYFISDDSAPVSAYYFNRLLVLYNFNTMITLFALLIFDAGKFWVALGMIHNTTEFVVLVLIGSGGRLKNINFYGILLCYIILVYCGTLFIDWPYDAVFFKFQGLCFDYALMITFIRIYFNTKYELKHGDGAERIPLTNEEANPDDHLHDQQYGFVHHPCQLLILVFASAFHNVGNLIATVSIEDLLPSILSVLTYAITYPVYMYYVYVDTHSTSNYPTKRIYLPSTPGWKKFVIATISICCALLTVRLGAFLQARQDHQSHYNLNVNVVSY
ncbi:patatin-domain-containing protein [Gigaspora margarita]|uniref:Patatin-domain-containing protein n=1 Tax=Gigaspora margarita TaxID=4874 RepID=A0A8H4ALJ8_GIGMA|nr:patatin-domain-containing protein [Gigaspora margarita]